jgi:hypothetical protein
MSQASLYLLFCKIEGRARIYPDVNSTVESQGIARQVAQILQGGNFERLPNRVKKAENKLEING